ncbi:hypothetical protein H311_02228, partial [Anncaliia algerae PRA109]
EQLFFYITHHKLSYPEYLKTCKQYNILPIAYVDQSILLEHVMKYENNTFDVNELHIPTLDYSFINEFRIDDLNYAIIVSSAENSAINLLNISDFLRDGIFIRKKIPLDYENLPIKVKSNLKRESFIVTDNFKYKEKNTKIIGVFLDGNSWQFKNSNFTNLKDLCNNMAVFYVSEEESKFNNYNGLDVSCIKVQNNSPIPKETLNFIWKKLYLFKSKE